MSENFNITFSENPNISPFHFGVFHSVVSSPDVYVCKQNDLPFSRFFYVVKGEIIFNKGTDDELHAEAGSIVYLPNNISYVSEWNYDEEVEHIALHFVIDELYIKLPNKICVAIYDKDKSYLEMFNKVLNIWETGAPGYKIEILSELYKIIYCMFKDTTYRNIKSDYRNIYKGILYLENHYMEDVTVYELAQMCHMSEGNFRRYFKNYTDMSPVTYRNYLRIKKARDLLRTGEYNVTEAAQMVNIYDNCYFHKLFKQFFNATPKNFIP